MAGRYRTKPIEVDAIPIAAILAADDDTALPAWVVLALEADPDTAVRAEPEDWLVRGAHGELYPCSSDAFEAMYEEVTGAESAPDEALDRRAW